MTITLTDMSAGEKCAWLDAQIEHFRALRRIARLERDALTDDERQSQRARLETLAAQPVNIDKLAAPEA